MGSDLLVRVKDISNFIHSLNFVYPWFVGEESHDGRGQPSQVLMPGLGAFEAAVTGVGWLVRSEERSSPVIDTRGWLQICPPTTPAAPYESAHNVYYVK